MKNTKTISFRCTEKQYEIIKEKAAKTGLDVSKYVSASAVNGSSRIRNTKKDMIRKVAQMQMKINDIDVLLKTGGNADTVSRKLMELQKEIDEVWKQ